MESADAFWLRLSFELSLRLAWLWYSRCQPQPGSCRRWKVYLAAEGKWKSLWKSCNMLVVLISKRHRLPLPRESSVHPRRSGRFEDRQNKVVEHVWHRDIFLLSPSPCFLICENMTLVPALLTCWNEMMWMQIPRVWGFFCCIRFSTPSALHRTWHLRGDSSTNPFYKGAVEDSRVPLSAVWRHK